MGLEGGQHRRGPLEDEPVVRSTDNPTGIAGQGDGSQGAGVAGQPLQQFAGQRVPQRDDVVGPGRGHDCPVAIDGQVGDGCGSGDRQVAGDSGLSGIGGDAYVHVATDRICAGTTAGEEIPSEPDHLGSEATDEEVLDDCRRKCDERADCTHFVSRDNQACKTYATCLVTEPGPDEVVTGQAASSERLYVNTRRAPGKCHVVPISGKWNACSEEDELCEVDTLSIVRFGAGKSCKYRLLDVDAATGFGNLTCSTRTFGLGSPGLRRCESAFVGVPARIAGPAPAFVEHVDL